MRNEGQVNLNLEKDFHILQTPAAGKNDAGGDSPLNLNIVTCPEGPQATRYIPGEAALSLFLKLVQGRKFFSLLRDVEGELLVF